jgi:hypothetical protein
MAEIHTGWPEGKLSPEIQFGSRRMPKSQVDLKIHFKSILSQHEKVSDETLGSISGSAEGGGPRSSPEHGGEPLPRDQYGGTNTEGSSSQESGAVTQEGLGAHRASKRARARRQQMGVQREGERVQVGRRIKERRARAGTQYSGPKCASNLPINRG